MGQDPRAPRYSPDGQWWWDGTAWRPVAPPPSPPSGGVPTGAIIAVIAGVVVVVLVTVSVLAFVAFRALNDSLTPAGNVVANGAIPCDQLEHTQVHYHAELQILDAGNAVPIPTGVGRTASCYYWLHMHTGEPGMIHIEAPDDRTFTLADFFSVWAMWSGEKQFLDRTHVSTIALTGDQKLVVYVDKGNGPTVYTDEPALIALENREVITLEITPPTITPPPAYKWPSGF